MGNTLRIGNYSEQMVDENPQETVGVSIAMANNPQLAAKSTAIAYAALKSFSSSGQIGINLGNDNTSKTNSLFTLVSSEKVIKLMNIVDPNKKLREGKLDDVNKDMKDEFSRFGKVKYLSVIRSHQVKVGGKLII